MMCCLRDGRVLSALWITLLLGCPAQRGEQTDAASGADALDAWAAADGAPLPDSLPGDAQAQDQPAVAVLQRLFFASNRSGTYQIWSADPQLAAPVQLTQDTTYNAWWPRVSPTEDLVYFYRSERAVQRTETNDYDNAALWRMKRDGSDPSEVLPSADWCSQGVIDFAPAGKRIVMAGRKRVQDACDGWQLFTANADLSQVTRLSQTDSLYLDPSWSPDGQSITFISIDRALTAQQVLAAILDGSIESHYEVFLMNADGTGEVQLTHDQIRDNDPYVSPDGSTIVFESQVDTTHAGGMGRWALRQVSAAGGQAATALLDDGNINTLARWTQDGTQLYFHRLTYDPVTGLPNRGWHLARIQRDGSGLHSVTPAGISGDVDVDLVYGSP